MCMERQKILLADEGGCMWLSGKAEAWLSRTKFIQNRSATSFDIWVKCLGGNSGLSVAGAIAATQVRKHAIWYWLLCVAGCVFHSHQRGELLFRKHFRILWTCFQTMINNTAISKASAIFAFNDNNRVWLFLTIKKKSLHDVSVLGSFFHEKQIFFYLGRFGFNLLSVKDGDFCVFLQARYEISNIFGLLDGFVFLSQLCPQWEWRTYLVYHFCTRIFFRLFCWVLINRIPGRKMHSWWSAKSASPATIHWVAHGDPTFRESHCFFWSLDSLGMLLNRAWQHTFVWWQAWLCDDFGTHWFLLLPVCRQVPVFETVKHIVNSFFSRCPRGTYSVEVRNIFSARKTLFYFCVARIDIIGEDMPIVSQRRELWRRNGIIERYGYFGFSFCRVHK